MPFSKQFGKKREWKGYWKPVIEKKFKLTSPCIRCRSLALALPRLGFIEFIVVSASFAAYRAQSQVTVPMPLAMEQHLIRYCSILFGLQPFQNPGSTTIYHSLDCALRFTDKEVPIAMVSLSAAAFQCVMVAEFTATQILTWARGWLLPFQQLTATAAAAEAVFNCPLLGRFERWADAGGGDSGNDVNRDASWLSSTPATKSQRAPLLALLNQWYCRRVRKSLRSSLPIQSS